jgi:hypothetical protein
MVDPENWIMGYATPVARERESGAGKRKKQLLSGGERGFANGARGSTTGARAKPHRLDPPVQVR